MQVRPHPRRAPRGARRSRPRDPSGWCPPWAGSTTATLAHRRARAESATIVDDDLRQPAASSTRRADFTRYPRDEAHDLALLRGGGRRHACSPDRRGGLPARASTRRSAWAPSPDRWRVPHAPATSTAWRPWSRSSSRSSARSGPTSARRTPSRSGHLAHGAGPRPADEGRPLPDRSRVGRTGAVVPQRPPLAGRAAPRRRCCGARCGRRGTPGQAVSVTANELRRSCRASWRRSRWRASTTSPSLTPRPSRS